MLWLENVKFYLETLTKCAEVSIEPTSWYSNYGNKDTVKQKKKSASVLTKVRRCRRRI